MTATPETLQALAGPTAGRGGALADPGSRVVTSIGPDVLAFIASGILLASRGATPSRSTGT
ncbi:MAG: hypothetical protein R3C32_02490 [Chloroflexota bacterium]